MASSDFVFVGIKGAVIALDRGTGTEVWRSPLKGSDFVNVVHSDGDLYASTRGELFSLDPGTGHIRWRNPLKGLGWGLVTIAGEGGSSSQATTAHKRKKQQEAAAAAGAAGATS
jgi:outer membrane protein assembly factor BamB